MFDNLQDQPGATSESRVSADGRKPWRTPRVEALPVEETSVAASPNSAESVFVS